MSIITPAGKAKLNWSPTVEENETVFTKTASTGDVEVVAEKSQQEIEKEALYQVAKGVVAQFSPCEDIECMDGVDVVDGSEGIDGIVNDVQEPISDEDGLDTGIKESLEQAEAALEEATSAIQDAKEECCGDEVDEYDEVEIPLDGDDSVLEIDVDVEDEDEGETDDFVVEGEKTSQNPECKEKPNNCGSVEAKKKGKTLEAGSSDEFVKLSKISPENRQKLYNYWTKDLGYPSDYAKLLVKDYEK